MPAGRVDINSPVALICCGSLTSEMATLKEQRRWARERAVQFLFQAEVNPPDRLDDALIEFWRQFVEDEDLATMNGAYESKGKIEADYSAAKLYAEELIRGVLEHREELDEHLRRLIKNWDLRRLAAVDRNVLRMAVYEMLYRPDIPPVVTINEAIEIAKKYSTEQSGRFVNGVLDRFRLDLLQRAGTCLEDLGQPKDRNGC